MVLSSLRKTIHRIEDPQLAAQTTFAFIGLYRRVSKFSEFRFWGGSGNSARLNVPDIFEESNVFASFERKARTILDHLETTARHYTGSTVVRTGSATDMAWLPDASVDLVFTDPPFGANINYSEMNLLWEAWLGRMTDPTAEAIVNKYQGKDVSSYGKLMEEGLSETFRVLRPGGWMLLVFMNSSANVWQELQRAIHGSGFVIVSADVFDKQHGTFKHFVSENTAGADLVLHCRKPGAAQLSQGVVSSASADLHSFLSEVDRESYVQSFIHVPRPSEPDARRLYSEWVARAMVTGERLVNFAAFRKAWEAQAK